MNASNVLCAKTNLELRIGNVQYTAQHHRKVENIPLVIKICLSGLKFDQQAFTSSNHTNAVKQIQSTIFHGSSFSIIPKYIQSNTGTQISDLNHTIVFTLTLDAADIHR